MVTLLKAEKDGWDSQKAYCIKSFDQTEDIVGVVFDGNAEQIVDVPVPRIREDVTQLIPQDRVSD